jgi:hypothetical protein
MTIRRITLLAALALLAPATAHAAAPEITSGPAITGAAQTGSRLTAAATWTGKPEPTATWQWLRCAPASGSCAAIDRATTSSYQVTEADLGSVLRVLLTVTSPPGSDEARSNATAVVTAPASAPAPEATPAPTPTVEPEPSAPPPPITFETAPAAPATPPAVSAPAARRALRPFPVVRVKGVLTARGARITLLSVRAPKGVRVIVRCRGRDCPLRRYAPQRAVRRLKRFERALRGGTRLDIKLVKPGYIGKRTLLVIRRGAAPLRTDGCVDSATLRSTRCSP